MNNVAACVRARLLNVVKAQQGVDFNQVLVRFALERIVDRLRVALAATLNRAAA